MKTQNEIMRQDHYMAARSYRHMKLIEKDVKRRAWLKRMERREKRLAVKP